MYNYMITSGRIVFLINIFRTNLNFEIFKFMFNFVICSSELIRTNLMKFPRLSKGCNMILFNVLHDVLIFSHDFFDQSYSALYRYL